MEQARVRVGLANCNSRSARHADCVDNFIRKIQAQDALPRYVILGRKSLAAPRAVVLDSNIQSGRDTPLCGFTGDEAMRYATDDPLVNNAVLVIGRDSVDVFMDKNITSANLTEACKNCDLQFD